MYNKIVSTNETWLKNILSSVDVKIIDCCICMMARCEINNNSADEKIVEKISDVAGGMVSLCYNIDNSISKFPTRSEIKAKMAEEERKEAIRRAEEDRIRQEEYRKNMIAECNERIDQLTLEISRCKVKVAEERERVAMKPNDTTYKRWYAQAKTELAKKENELAEVKMKLKNLKQG